MVLGVPETSPFDVPTVFHALRWSMEAMWPEVSRINLLQAVPELKVPVFFLLGRNDHWAAPDLAEAYFEVLQAPTKRLLWFERSGHEPFADEPARFTAALIEEVLPVIRRTSQAPPPVEQNRPSHSVAPPQRPGELRDPVGR